MAGPSNPASDAFMSKSLSSLAGRIVRECTHSGMSQFEKAVALYDWLIDHTVYKGGNTTDAYRVLRSGEASCGGYTNAYIALLDKVGIQSKPVDGDIYTLRHQWNKVKLGGKWYHVDVRMGDHLKDIEGRYRRFGMSDEQARLYYKFKNISAKSHSYNHAFRTGQLDGAISYVHDALTRQIALGETFFSVDLTANDAPAELADPFNRIMAKNAVKGLRYAYPNIPDPAKVSLQLSGSQLIVRVNVPKYRVKRLTRTIPAAIHILAPGGDYSAIEPLELGDKLLVAPAHATQPTIYWKSYREKTAVVDQNGTVRIVGPGKAKILATTIDGSKKTCKFHITVKPY